MNTEAGTLNDICIQIRNHLHNKYSVEKMTSRLRQMLDKVISSQDRTSKHALVLFALYKNPEIIPDIFLPETPRVPPKKFKYFVERDLPVLVKKLLSGAFTSSRAFVEDARWTYITL